MVMRSVFLAAAALTVLATATPSVAHERDYSYNRHARDHAAHWRFHRRVGNAHARAHDEGFDNRSEHRAYHRALRDQHGEFHEDYPGTRHDHRRW